MYKISISDDLSIINNWNNKYSSNLNIQKMTGSNKNISNFYSDIDLFYAFTYYIDFTELTSFIFQNYNSEYNDIISQNGSIISLYTDENLQNNYFYNENINHITYNQLNDKYNYFNNNLPSSLPIVKLKITITDKLPHKLYYGINFVQNAGNNNEQRFIIKGGVINIYSHNISMTDVNKIGYSDDADNILINYKNNDDNITLLENRVFYLYFNNLYDNDLNNLLYKSNEYQNTIESYLKTPDLEHYHFYLIKNDKFKDDTYDMTYKLLHDKIDSINNLLYNDVKGLTNTSIKIISSLIDPVLKIASLTINNNNNNYTNEVIYLNVDNNYVFNLDNNSTYELENAVPSLMGNFIIETVNGVLDLISIITVNTNSNFILTKNKLLILGGPLNSGSNILF